MNINTPEYWDKEWEKREARVYPYYQKIKELVGEAHVLDFGCGRGDLLSLFPNGFGMDFSSKAIEIVKSRRLHGEVGSEPTGDWDVIVATELMEHVDDDVGLLRKFFEHAPTVIYAVPNECLTPEEEPEHVRTYSIEYVRKITPHLKRVWEIGRYLVVLASQQDISFKPSVLCAVMNEGWIKTELVTALTHMVFDDRVELSIKYPQLRPIDHNRNEMVKRFMQGTWEYLLMIDADNPPLRNPLDLVSLDLDVVGLSVPQWNMKDPKFPIYFVGMDKADDGYREHKDKTGLQKVDSVGTGCILIARRVLEKVKAPFMRKWDEDGRAILGLDFHFCEKAKQEGFGIWCHYGYCASHFKEVDLLDILAFKHAD